MTDKQIIIEDCPYFVNGVCMEYLDGACENHKCDLKIIRELEQKLKAKEQECEGLKEEIKKHNDDMFKNPPEKRFYCKGCTLPYISKKLKQTLTEIKEIAEPYYTLGSKDSPVVQILQKISEVE